MIYPFTYLYLLPKGNGEIGIIQASHLVAALSRPCHHNLTSKEDFRGGAEVCSHDTGCEGSDADLYRTTTTIVMSTQTRAILQIATGRHTEQRG